MAGSVVGDLCFNLGLRATELLKGLQQAQGELRNTAGAMGAVEAKWKGVVGGLVRSVAAPVAGMLSLGAAAKSYFNGVAEVARLTGAYSPKMEEWRKKRATLQRVTREDIELYRKGREAMTRFQISMEDLSAKAMRSAAPAMRWLYDALNKVSGWVDRNQDNIIRFLQVTAAVITTALIPAFIRMAAVLWKNPLTWIIALLGALALVIDDLVVYCQGGKSAFADFWAQFGTGEELSRKLGNAWVWLKETLIALLPFIVYFGSALVGLKMGVTVVSLLAKAWEAVSKALMLLKGHPAIAILTVIIGLVTWFVDALDRAGGSWRKAFGVMWQDAKKFLNQFGGLGDLIESAVTTAIGWLGQLWDWIKQGIDWVVDFGHKLADALSIDNLIAKAKKALGELADKLSFGIFGSAEEEKDRAEAEAGEQAEGQGQDGEKSPPADAPEGQGEKSPPARPRRGGRGGQKPPLTPEQVQEQVRPSLKRGIFGKMFANWERETGKATPTFDAVPPAAIPPVAEVDRAQAQQRGGAGNTTVNDEHNTTYNTVNINVNSNEAAAEVAGDLLEGGVGPATANTAMMATH